MQPVTSLVMSFYITSRCWLYSYAEHEWEGAQGWQKKGVAGERGFDSKGIVVIVVHSNYDN